MIEEVLERIAVAVEAIAATVGNDGVVAPKAADKKETAKKEAPKQEQTKKEAPKKGKAKKAPEVDYEAVKKAAMDAVEIIQRDGVAEILAKFGAAKLNQLEEDDFASFIDAINDAVANLQDGDDDEDEDDLGI